MEHSSMPKKKIAIPHGSNSYAFMSSDAITKLIHTYIKLPLSLHNYPSFPCVACILTSKRRIMNIPPHLLANVLTIHNIMNNTAPIIAVNNIIAKATDVLPLSPDPL